MSIAVMVWCKQLSHLRERERERERERDNLSHVIMQSINQTSYESKQSSHSYLLLQNSKLLV